MKITTLAATNHKNSINQQLVRTVGNALNAEQHLHLDLNDYPLPIYSQDIEEHSGIPAAAHELFEKIQRADLLLLSFAEHNGSYTAAYKNAFDWMSRIQQKVFTNVLLVNLSTSPGPGGAKNVLAQANNSAPFFGGSVVYSESVPNFHSQLDEHGAIHSALIKRIVDSVTQALPNIS